MLLKGKLGPISGVIEAVVEAVCKGHGSGSLGQACGFNPVTNRPEFSGALASN